MVKKRSAFFAIIFVLGTFISCKNNKVEEPIVATDYLKITIQPVFGAENLNLNQTFVTTEGYQVQFTDIKCYWSLVKNGTSSLTQSALFDYGQRGTLLVKVPGKSSDFESLTARLGVDASINHDDPSAFPNSSWLNIANANDMHWDWNSGYIFVKVEAKVDTLADGIDNFNHYAIFHIGTDAYIQDLAFNSLNWQTESEHVKTLQLKLDLQKFLQNGSQTIDLKTEHTSHSAAGQETLSLKVIENFRDALSQY